MYFTPVWILSLILTSLRPHYCPTLVPFHLTLVRHLQSTTPPTQLRPPPTSSAPTLQVKLRTQTFRKGATHNLKPSPSDITAIRLSNSVIGPQDHYLTNTHICIILSNRLFPATVYYPRSLPLLYQISLDIELVKSSKFNSCNSRMVSLKMKDMVASQYMVILPWIPWTFINREDLYTYTFIYQEDWLSEHRTYSHRTINQTHAPQETQHAFIRH